MKKLDYKGFSAVEALLILVIVGIIGGVGYYIYNANKKTDDTFNAAAKSAQSSPSKITKKTANATDSTQKSLAIKEWGVSLELSAATMTATYKIKDDTAWLSTKQLDQNAACVKYNGTDTLSFQGIVRHKATDTIQNDSGSFTAEQGAKSYPETFVKVGNYVYEFTHGNGSPCEAQSVDLLDAFKTAFATIHNTNR